METSRASNNQHDVLKYSTRFEDDKVEATQRILSWGRGDRCETLNLDSLESCVFVKNDERVIVHVNLAFRRKISGGSLAIGSTIDRFLPPGVRSISRMTDELVASGVKSLELEFDGIDDNNHLSFQSFKRRLDELGDPSFCLLVVFRPLAMWSDFGSNRISSEDQLGTFRELDTTDQEICRRYFLGDSTKVIAESVGLTTRSVEIRRQRVMESFGFSKPVEIVKLLTRLAEHDLIEIGSSSSATARA